MTTLYNKCNILRPAFLSTHIKRIADMNTPLTKDIHTLYLCPSVNIEGKTPIWVYHHILPSDSEHDTLTQRVIPVEIHLPTHGDTNSLNNTLRESLLTDSTNYTFTITERDSITPPYNALVYGANVREFS